MLKIKKLTVHYGPRPALNESSLEVKQGEIVSLLGPNGAGKTTLLLTLSGILKTTEGRILFEGAGGDFLVEPGGGEGVEQVGSLHDGGVGGTSESCLG